jgi:hypothetical protein
VFDARFAWCPGMPFLDDERPSANFRLEAPEPGHGGGGPAAGLGAATANRARRAVGHDSRAAARQ